MGAGPEGGRLLVVDALLNHAVPLLDMPVQVKMELFAAERDEVLILLERVSEAQRLATMQMKESDGGKGEGGRKRRDKGGGCRQRRGVQRRRQAARQAGEEATQPLGVGGEYRFLRGTPLWTL